MINSSILQKIIPHSTYRVRLRNPKLSDALYLYKWRNENSIKAHQPIIPLNIEQIQQDIEKTASNDLSDYGRDRFQWIIEHTTANRPVGWITLSIRSWEHLIAEIGYSVAEDYQKQGYGTEALQLCLEKIFHEGGLWRIEAKCSVENTASYKLLEKVGFKKEGCLRSYFNIHGRRVDHYLYSLLVEEYQTTIR